MPSRLVLVFALLALLPACSNTETGPTDLPQLSSVDVRTGTGGVATTGTSATVRYTGWLYAPTEFEGKGTEFDTGTLTFAVGTTALIEGFSNGVTGMRVGGLRRMILPPNLAFGPNGAPPVIPGNATVLFDVELLSIQ